MNTTTDPRAPDGVNRLLMAMNHTDFELLRPFFEVVQLARRAVLLDAGEALRHAYFPHSGVICLLAVMKDSAVAETAIVGPEGVVGIEGFLGQRMTPHRIIVQVAGPASRIGIRELRDAADHSASLRALLLRYLAAFLAQVTQSVACSSLHKLEERCARWLLMCHDRAGCDEFDLTQETLAERLGVHRPTVTIIARRLQAAGLIRYSRGTLTILDRICLERFACECYANIKQACAQIS